MSDYVLVHSAEIGDYLKAGWEPVPNVEHVVDRALSIPQYYCFLRRYSTIGESPDE